MSSRSGSRGRTADQDVPPALLAMIQDLQKEIQALWEDREQDQKKILVLEDRIRTVENFPKSSTVLPEQIKNLPTEEATTLRERTQDHEDLIVDSDHAPKDPVPKDPAPKDTFVEVCVQILPKDGFPVRLSESEGLGAGLVRGSVQAQLEKTTDTIYVKEVHVATEQANDDHTKIVLAPAGIKLSHPKQDPRELRLQYERRTMSFDNDNPLLYQVPKSLTRTVGACAQNAMCAHRMEVLCVLTG